MPELGDRLRANARKTVQQRFSLSAHARDLQNIYEEALEINQARQGSC